MREPNCSDINKKICCGLYNSQHKLQSGFFPVVDVDMRLLHPSATLLDQLSESVVSHCSVPPRFIEGAAAFAVWYVGFNQIFPQLPAISQRSQLNYSMFLVMDGLWIEAVLL